MFRFFSSPGCGFIVIGYYVAAGIEEHMHDIHTSGGREICFSAKHIPILRYTYSGSQEKEFLHGYT